MCGMEHVGEAARRTLAQRGARVSHVTFLDPPGRHGLVDRWHGVADLAAARSHLVAEPGGAWDRIGEEFVRRWPWLADDDEDDAGPIEQVEADGTIFHGFDGRWWAGEPAAKRRHCKGPAWILETLAGPVTVDEGGDGDVRVLVEESPRVRAFVRIGDDGLIRRVAWTSLERRRRPPDSMLWHVIELSEFGIAVDIPTPAVTPEPDDDDEPFWRIAGELALDLYRRRRDWRATHSR